MNVLFTGCTFSNETLKRLEENQYIKEVNNWGDIYRNIKSLDQK